MDEHAAKISGSEPLAQQAGSMVEQPVRTDGPRTQRAIAGSPGHHAQPPTTAACARCDWTPAEPFSVYGTPTVQQLDHANHANHPLCIICAVSLHEEEAQTCTGCVARVRRELNEIIDLYAQLPAELEHHGSERLPGGRAMVALAPGSSGIGQWRAHVAGADCSHDADEQPDDGEPVAFTLSRIEDEWRRAFADPPAMVPGAMSVAEHDPEVRLLTESVGYLTRRLGRAAAEDPVFAESATDISRLVHGLRAILREGPQRDVPCTKCNVALLLEPEFDADGDPVGGLYRCPKCKRRYDEASYWVAVHQHLVERREAS